MIRLTHQNACFIHIPKTGGDYVKEFLLENIAGAQFIGPGKHWPAAKHKVVPNFSFAFVREPVSWYKSWYAFVKDHYIDIYGEHPIWEAGLWHPQRRFEKYDYSTFESFIYSVYEDEPSYYTRMLEWYVGPPDANIVNYVGKQERLGEHMAILLDKWNLSHLKTKVQTGKRINTSNSSFKIEPHIGELIESNERVVYRRFGYNHKFLTQ